MALSKPYTFVAGTTIMSSEVNSDFDTLFTAIGNQMYTEDNYIADDQTVTASLDALDMRVKDHDDNFNRHLYGLMQRAAFTYNGGSTAYTVKVSAAAYFCKTKHCFWNSELTTSAIGTPVASTWYYLYLDYSAITSGTAITATELIWSSTAPAWNATYRGWYNGDDRCIFAALTNSGPTNIGEFFHGGERTVFWADAITRLDGGAPGNTWSAVDLDPAIPAFSTTALVLFYAVYVDGAASLYWRTNSQTGTTGHFVVGVSADATLGQNTLPVIGDTTYQRIDVKFSAVVTNTVSVLVDGWLLPLGM